MKTLKSILYAFIAVFIFAGCDDDGDYLAGAPENPDCYNVYFPAQDNASDVELDPAADTKLSFIVRRLKSDGAITVPVSVKKNQGNVFAISAIEFADGQEETSFDVNFPETEVGTKYACEINIDDTKYASVYGEKSVGMTFSVTRVKWNLLTGGAGETKGKWRDDVISSLFGVTNANAEVELEIYERDDRPGYYRMVPYTQTLISALFGRNVGSCTEPYTIIDATDPDKVWIPYQTTGVTLGGDGEIEIASKINKNIPSVSEAASLYGTLKDGVITFPASSIYVNFTISGGWYGANASGMQRIVLPGAKVYDYTLSLSKPEPKNGVVELGFTFGADVAKVQYAFFEGALSEALAEAKSKEMAEGGLPTQEIAATGTVNAVMNETGMYSVLGNIYNAAGELQGYSYLAFGYVKDGDEKPVLMSVGLNITDKYANKGYTAEDSAEFWANGQEIESGYYGLYETEALAGATEADLITLVTSSQGMKFSAENLEAINKADGTFALMLGGLNGGTNYTLLVYAYNGYVSKLMTAQATTEGTPHPLKRNYTMDDFLSTQLSKAGMCKTWNYYAGTISNSVASGKRAKVGTVTITDNTTADTAEADYLNISGLSGIGRLIGGDDTMLIEYYNGVLYSISDQIIGSYGGEPVSYWMTTTTLKAYSVDYALIGGQVVDGYLAFVANPNYIASNGLTFDGMRFLTFSDESLGTATGGLVWLYNLMLEDPGKAVPMSAPAATVTRPQLEKISSAFSAPDNFVELRGRERMRALIDEYIHSDRDASNVARPVMTVVKSEAKTASARVTVSQGVAPKVSAPVQVMVKKGVDLVK